MIVSTSIGGLRSNGGTNRARCILHTVHTYQREGTGTEEVLVVLRLDTDGLGGDAIE